MSDPSMVWSYTPPVFAAWYWWQKSANDEPIIVRYFYDEGWWLMSRGLLVSAKSQSGRFCGPIPAPYAFATWGAPS